MLFCLLYSYKTKIQEILCQDLRYEYKQRCSLAYVFASLRSSSNIKLPYEIPGIKYGVYRIEDHNVSH